PPSSPRKGSRDLASGSSQESATCTARRAPAWSSAGIPPAGRCCGLADLSRAEETFKHELERRRHGLRPIPAKRPEPLPDGFVIGDRFQKIPGWFHVGRVDHPAISNGSRNR